MKYSKDTNGKFFDDKGNEIKEGGMIKSDGSGYDKSLDWGIIDKIVGEGYASDCYKNNNALGIWFIVTFNGKSHAIHSCGIIQYDPA